MKSIYLSMLLLLISAYSWSVEISVGGVSLTIPSPAGFSPVTQEMALLYDYQKQFVAPTNEQFVAFIPEQYVPEALKYEIPNTPRRFVVQTGKSIIDVSVTKADFSTLKKAIKSQNAELFKKVEAQLPEVMGKINEGIKENYDVDLALSVSQMVPMPVHEETDRTLSYSSFIKYEMKDDMGNPVPYVSVVTATFVHVKGKVLFLYSYAGEADLEWSKSASRKWAESIVDANPSDLKTTAEEAIPSSISRIDWGQVGVKALAGAVIGLVIGLIGWLRNRRKSS